MRWPLDSFTITQTFNSPPGHGGLDLAAPKGTDIHSPVTGTVIGDGEDPNYVGGKYVIVREDGGARREFYMGHMDSNSVVNGQHVTEGQVIGKVGQTGQATGPHVHFQIRNNGGGALINPAIVYKSQGDDMSAVQDAETRQGFLRQIAKAVSVDYRDGNDLPQVINNIKAEQNRIDELTGIVGRLEEELKLNPGTLNKDNVLEYVKQNLK